jgi:hypothetical protein
MFSDLRCGICRIQTWDRQSQALSLNIKLPFEAAQVDEEIDCGLITVLSVFCQSLVNDSFKFDGNALIETPSPSAFLQVS